MTTLEAEWDAMVAAVLADPADYQPRLAYADWLDDHDERPGDDGPGNRFAERAEFIRLQINSPMPSGDAIEVTPALVRLSELWYGAEIGAGRAAAEGFEMPVDRSPDTPWGDWSFSMVDPFDGTMRPYAWVRGGFVEQLSLPAVLFLGGTCPACDDDTRAAGLAAHCWCGGTGDLPSVAPAVFAQQPVRRVTLSDFHRNPDIFSWNILQETGAANVAQVVETYYRIGASRVHPERAVDLLSDALVEWGRRQARGRSHLRKCPNVHGTAARGVGGCGAPGCYEGHIRVQGLPPLPSREAADV